MGCSSSKQKICENCQVPLSGRVPRRRKSMDVHHMPGNRGDSYHLVSLTSRTLGSVRLDPIHTDHFIVEELAPSRNFVGDLIELKSKETFVLVEAKTWYKMLEEKIPKVLPKTSVQMEGLEDSPPSHHPSFSFNLESTTNNSIFYDDLATPDVKQNAYQHTESVVAEADDCINVSDLHSDSESIVPQFDSEVKPLMGVTGKELMSKNEELEACDVKMKNCIVDDYKPVALEKEKLVFYFTSLGAVRKTYEGLGVKIDERDVSMYLGFKEELKELLGERYPGSGLPKLFIGTKFIGGAEEIRLMNEAGQLEKLVEKCEKVDNNWGLGGGNCGVCEACGDIRFLLCYTCSGSCKILCEGEFDEGNEVDEYGFQRCPNCNENGLIRCLVCCE